MALGYVNPSSEPEPRGFDNQFEWDGHGWLFRRFHRARPVRVTADEMDQSIEFYERWRSKFGTAAIAATIAVLVVWFYLDAKDIEWADARGQGLAAATLAAVGWTGNRWAWVKATERFKHRVPVGLGQTWLEQRQSDAAEQDWGALLALPLFIGFIAFLMWPLSEARWFEIAMAAVAGLAALFNLLLKLRARFL